ncbi:MAG TPA: lamin tail domain-containing protein, partial [Thermoguttaceae bacterium]|nr:lamin tail domain-containing protein [Thermoguttaceae bacterium]
VLKHNNNTIINGSNATYNTMMSIANAGVADDAGYELIQQYLDVPDLIDYMITNFYTGNTDWDHHNWYASRNRVDPEGRWRFHSWDAEHVLKSLGDNVTGVNNNNSPSRLHQQLSQNEEYAMLFADHVHRHFFNDGLLTPTNAAAMYQTLLDKVDRAVVGESARWGDNRREPPYTRDADWVAEANRLRTQYFPIRTNTVLIQLRGRGLYPNVTAPSFLVDGAARHGGVLEPGELLEISQPGGAVYYTLDGSDPRLPGGEVSPQAVIADGNPIALQTTARVKSRAWVDGKWSALNEADFFVVTPADATSLAITELNYNPVGPTTQEIAAAGADVVSNDFEFLELRNTGETGIDLAGVRFDAGLTFAFGVETVEPLAPGESVVIVADEAAFTARYGDSFQGTTIRVAGEYEGRLSDGGEQLRLLDRFGQTIVDFEYNDSGAWPGRADGSGSSLEVLDTKGDYNDAANWRSSSEYGGSPGVEGIGPIYDVVVNEVLSHSGPGVVDAVELLNTSNHEIDLGGWYLSDTNDNYQKFRIPDGTILASGEYRVFDENDFNPSGGIEPLLHPNDFALSGSHGDDVWLLAADAAGHLTHFVDHGEFPAAALGETFGRWPSGTGSLVPMLEPTLGFVNSGPRVGPIVLSEVHYHPLDANPNDTVSASDLEFVELYNPTSASVDLTDWRLRGGIDFDFATDTMLPSNATLVVVSFDPSDPAAATRLAQFMADYAIDGSVALVGGYSNKLDNGGDRVQLQRPDVPPLDEPDYVPHLIEDEVIYDDANPWPVEADGMGLSLHRRAVDAWGHDASSWTAGVPTPGTAELDVAAAQVVGRYVFYNNSKFDGENPAANTADDQAIAVDKTALLPGQTATPANVGSFHHGINRIVIDVSA